MSLETINDVLRMQQELDLKRIVELEAEIERLKAELKEIKSYIDGEMENLNSINKSTDNGLTEYGEGALDAYRQLRITINSLEDASPGDCYVMIKHWSYQPEAE